MTYSFQKIKILIIEDNAPMLELLRKILQSFGIGTIITALNGEEGFIKFCQSNPDLVITDWMMAPCDGIALSHKIRNERKSPNQYVPIILMTGFSEKKRVISARDSGITEFLVKPFNTRDLYRRIHQIIERPRKFIRCEEFFGPDRRRKMTGIYGGPLRRQDDTVSKDNIFNTEVDSESIDITDIDFL
ncbi:MAG: response regulator [Zetaproteobacteria bacterium]|nr:MAG: response regulator [Zetaproteobacteria bacterium]